MIHLYTSTRKKLNLASKFCIEKGISTDGGLFIKDKYDDYDLKEEDKNLDYLQLTKKIFRYYFADFSDEEIEEVISNGYNSNNFSEKLYHLQSFNDYAFLELYHGPTMAFKDMALTILPHLLNKSKGKGTKKTLILTATSGDTGGAALSGFSNAKDVSVIVLYPTDGVSHFQEHQMQYYTNDHNMAIAVNGNFDDCQNLVKKIFNSDIKLNNYELSSANSINIGRLIPQIVYYFASYYEMVRQNKIIYGEKINFVVPTGNFGNILACYLAKKMGLFIDKIVCASNENDVLTDFFHKGVYDKNRLFKVTDSPAMDILISSNLERLLYLASNNDCDVVKHYMEELKNNNLYKIEDDTKKNLKDFLASSVNNEKTLDLIKKCYKDNHYLIDPHTAVAYGAYLDLKEQLNGKTVIVSTASPYKFLDAMRKAFNISGSDHDVINKLNVMISNKEPEIMNKILNNKFNKTIWQKEEMEEKLIKLIGDIDGKN